MDNQENNINEELTSQPLQSKPASPRDSFGLYGFIAATIAWILLFLASWSDSNVVEWVRTIFAVAATVLSFMGLGRRFPNLAIAGLIMSVVLLLVILIFMIALKLFLA